MSISHLLRCASTMALNKIGQFKQLSAARMSGESWDCARLQKFYPQATEPLLDALSDGATSCAKTVQIVKNLSLGHAQNVPMLMPKCVQHHVFPGGHPSKY